MPLEQPAGNATEEEGRRRPHNLEAEVSVLGAVFCRNEALDDVRDIIDSSEDFYRPAHQKIYRAMCALRDGTQAIDYVTVGEELLRRGELEEVGGSPALMRLAEAVPTSANAVYYARIVADRGLTRRLLDASQEIAGDCFKGAEAGEELVERAEQKIFGISTRRSRESLVHVKDVVVRAFDAITQASKSAGGVTGVPTGYLDFDRKTGGLKSGELFILAARTSMGKTALALNMARNAALDARLGVAVFSLEMDKEQLVQRLISSESGIGLQAIREGYIGKSHFQAMARATNRIMAAPLFIDDSPGISVARMRGRLLRLKSQRFREIRARDERLVEEALERGETPPEISEARQKMEALGLVAVDYLQLVKPPELGRYASRENEISAISRGLKELSREVEAPFMVLSQISRKAEDRKETGKRPQLADLRESGAIEQDADLVAFIFREAYYLPDDDAHHQEKEEKRHLAELILAKQRNGPTGTIRLHYDSDTVTFRTAQKEGGE